jgi:hypothetical protein
MRRPPPKDVPHGYFNVQLITREDKRITRGKRKIADVRSRGPGAASGAGGGFPFFEYFYRNREEPGNIYSV